MRRKVLVPWTDEHDRILRDRCPFEGVEALAAKMGRSAQSVRNRAWRLGVGDTSHRWTAEQVAGLRALYATQDADIARLRSFAAGVGKSTEAVCDKARAIGLGARRFATDAERRAWNADRLRRLWQEREHPRGALGHRHNAETRARIGERSRAAAARRTPEERSAIGGKAVATRIERYGTANTTPAEHAHSRAKQGRREDLGGQFFRSAWEANYARYLNWLVSQGEIRSWRYEPVTFWFEAIRRGVRSYTPDFEIVNADGTIEYHEVKGWDYARGQTARKRMAKYHPGVKLVLVDAEAYRALAKWRRVIPGWE